MNQVLALICAALVLPSLWTGMYFNSMVLALSVPWIPLLGVIWFSYKAELE